MFFKRLEINGFKSFATKTEVLFKPGVTVIVGPNGCGKSNIFDSVRWVLGEQKPKSLRGNKMGDVIFSGTDTLKPAAMAQVTLTVSNEDRRLPIDFNEVTVARRLLRTGESEYYINRHPCRLRDIVELFMDTGVGTNAYSIMEQGRIDQIINARPVDRREIFEEAAGVSKYRARRAETQRRLDRTEEDLIRLADIIAEVKRQANSLKRQASRAERYKKFSAELAEIEMQLLAHRWRSHKANSAKLEEELQAVENRFAEVSSRLTQMEADHDSKLNITENINRELHELGIQIANHTANIHDTERRLGLLHQRREINSNRSEELAREAEAHRGRRDALIGEIRRLEHERLQREEAFKERERVHTERRAQMEQIREGINESERHLGDLRRKHSDLRTEQLNLDNEIRLAAMMGEKTEDELRAVAAQRDEQTAKLDEIRAAQTEREAAHTTASQELAALSERIEGIQDRLGNLTDEETEVREALQACTADLGDTKSRHEALLTLQANFEGYREGVRSVMQAADQGTIHGVIGTVATLLSPQAGHESALEAALNGGEQIIVTRAASERDAVIQWLHKRQSGRATILALDSVREMAPRDSSVTEREDVIAWADEVVDCEDHVRPALHHLLGDTLIVTNLDAAKRLSGEGVARRCVTPDGEVATGGAQITGGQLKVSGLLTREREIAELAKRVERLQQERTDLAERQETLTKARHEVDSDLREATGTKQRHEITLAELAKDLEMAKRETKASEEISQRLTWRSSELEKQIEKHLDQRANAAERLDEIRAEISSLEEDLKSAQSQNESTGAEARRLSEEVQALAIEVARAREQMETLRLRLSNLQAEHDELNKRITTSEEECERLEHENNNAAEEIERLDKGLAEQAEARRKLEDLANAQRDEGNATGLELKRLSQEVHIVTRERNELQNRLQDLKVQRSQHTMHLDHCDEEAQEKFHTPMAEILAANPEPLEDPTPLREQANHLRERLTAMGPVNVIAIEEYNELRERLEFLTTQEVDLLAAKKNLENTIDELDKTSEKIFIESFTKIRNSFQSTFRRLFGGGRADLIPLEPDDLLNTGIEIIAQPPGKKLQSISLLSGGEKALTAIALLFGIFEQKPSPFCVLDEIDAPLDDKNIGRFKDLLTEFCQTTQFIIITHNKLTMQLADVLFGITMEQAGVSRLVGVDISKAEQYAAA